MGALRCQIAAGLRQHEDRSVCGSAGVACAEMMVTAVSAAAGETMPC
jgi:hypothetical protein